MIWQSRAFHLSLAVHALLILVVLGLGRPVVRPKPLVIDFNIEAADGAPAKPLQNTPHPERRPAPSRKQAADSVGQPVKTIAETVIKHPPARSISENRLPVPTPVIPDAPRGDGNGNTGMATHAATGPAPAGKGESDADADARKDAGGTGNEKAGYLRKNLAYIKDLVQKNASYPRMARKMGWQGKVVVAFTILSDGSAKELRVMEGCGIEMLNNSAMEAVKKASPFPKPPVEAQVVLPIVYKLY